MSQVSLFCVPPGFWTADAGEDHVATRLRSFVLFANDRRLGSARQSNVFSLIFAHVFKLATHPSKHAWNKLRRLARIGFILVAENIAQVHFFDPNLPK